jgi:hypothetical protein
MIMMLPLELRQEFLGRHMHGTAIELHNKQNSGWAQRGATDLLRITYPTADVQNALHAISRDASGKPIVFLGQRGRGKSHIMALLHHAVESPDLVERWARDWAARLPEPAPILAGLVLRRGFRAVSEALSNQEYANLWDVLFERHPRGLLYRGKFEQSGTAVPAASLIEDMCKEQPTALILDECQTWYDGLHDEAGPGGRKRRHWAFNFLQILSELSTKRPDLFVLAISVRNSDTEAYRQVLRDGPRLVDFKGKTSRQDRKRLLLHRLFENRGNFAEEDIGRLVAPYAAERLRLLHPDATAEEKERLTREVAEAWPFAPELLTLLEDHVLMAEAAQETRDLIRILASIVRSRGRETPLLTGSDFALDDDTGVTPLIDSFATTHDQERLREIALRNLQAVADAGVLAPHAKPVLSSIWLRSLSTTGVRGGTRQELQLDLVPQDRTDDNAFTLELDEIVENSVNVHTLERGQETRYCFRNDENPLSKLKAVARNARHFEPEGPTPPGLLPQRRDQVFVRQVLTHLLRSPDGATQPPSRPTVLDPNWQRAPWANLSQEDQPERWDRPVLLVLPTAPADTADVLGPWLAEHVPVRRNLVRFLLPKAGSADLYDDRPLLITARCALLAKEWKENDSRYAEYARRFDRELRRELSERFDRYALLSRWNFPEPRACAFHTEAHRATGADIPAVVEKLVRENFFAPEDFEAVPLECARRGDTMRQLLDVLREPPPRPDVEAIPFLGETVVYEQVLRLAARGKIALNVDGTWHPRETGQTEDEALRTLRQKAFRTGRELDRVQLGLPSQVGGGTGVAVTSRPIPAASPGAGPLFQPPVVGGGTPVSPAPASFGTAAPAASAPVPGPGTVSEPQPIIRRSSGARNGVNLLGELEKWGLPLQQKITQATLTFTGLTVKELRELCARLPPRLQAELQLTLPPSTQEGSP